MKHNLKTKPKLSKIPTLEESLRFNVQVMEWFEGFEKELRDLLEILETDEETFTFAIEKIKEILGET